MIKLKSRQTESDQTTGSADLDVLHLLAEFLDLVDQALVLLLGGLLQPTALRQLHTHTHTHTQITHTHTHNTHRHRHTHTPEE